LTNETWRPLGFEEEAGAEFSGLTDGIPPWLYQSFWDWTERRFRINNPIISGGRSLNSFTFDLPLLRKAERVCHFSVQHTSVNYDNGRAALRIASSSAGNQLRLADFLLSQKSSGKNELDSLLQEAGSAWGVGERAGKTGLVRRVAEGVQIASENVMENSGHAGERLAEAWTAAFGIDPNPSQAYSLAIKAVEDAAIPVVSAADRSATLGKIIGQMKAQGDWTLPFQRYDRDVPAGTELLAQMKTLWSGQVDRHGGPSATVTAVTQEAAEAAVLMAVPLVHAFASGLAARRSG